MNDLVVKEILYWVKLVAGMTIESKEQRHELVVQMVMKKFPDIQKADIDLIISAVCSLDLNKTAKRLFPCC